MEFTPSGGIRGLLVILLEFQGNRMLLMLRVGNAIEFEEFQ